MGTLEFLKKHINFNMKDDYYDQIQKYGLSTAFLVICGIILKSPGTSILTVYLSILFMPFWAYIMHRTLHNIDTWDIIKQFNPHILFHHSYDKPLPRSLELFIEVMTDIFIINLSIIPLQFILGANLLSLSSVLLFTLTYTSIHLINYSIIGTKFHGMHHKTKNTNFAPDNMDHFFGTNFNEEREDLNPVVLNTIGSAAVLYYFRDIIQGCEKWLFSQTYDVK